MPHDAACGLLPLAGDVIHLWRASLDVPANKLVALEAALSPDECTRADRFRFPEHRTRFVAAQGILREILGIHLAVDPARLKFGYNEHGKPFLAEPANACVEFNLSHSADLAVYAVARDFPVGVDVEFIKPHGSWLRIAEHYFSAEEFSVLSNLPEQEMREEFFDLWAVKEARLKALGVGLRYPLSETGDDSRWSVMKLKPMPGYSAALAFGRRETAPVVARHHFVV